MLKIAQICSVLPPYKDAVGESALKLKILLNEKGYKCILLTSYNQKKNKDVILFFNGWGLFEIIKSISILKKNSIKLVILHYPTPYYKKKLFITFIPFIYRLSGIITICYLHEYSIYSVLGKIRILPLIIFGTKIITTDQSNYSLIKKIPFALKKLSIIPTGSNFFDNSFTEFAKNYVDIKQLRKKQRLDVLYFGFIREGKGLDVLIDVIERNKFIRESFNLHLVGGLAEIHNKEYENLINKLLNSDLVEYHGHLEVDELFILAKSIDLICLPFIEGVTIKRSSFMTAMALGIPVLTTKGKFPIKDLNHFENVIFIESCSYLELEKSMISILDLDANELIKIGNNAKRWYENNFSDKVYIKRILNVISTIES